MFPRQQDTYLPFAVWGVCVHAYVYMATVPTEGQKRELVHLELDLEDVKNQTQAIRKCSRHS